MLLFCFFLLNVFFFMFFFFFSSRRRHTRSDRDWSSDVCSSDLVADLRKAVTEAAVHQRAGLRTVLFIDEIHRFNKAQQDAILPHVENGTVTLIGATTENPSFEVIAPLLSRSRVFRLE